MSPPLLILLVHALATFFMCGVIWFVQLVHYPLFRSVGRTGFDDYARDHARRTTWVVAPPMILELVTAVALLWMPHVVPTWKSLIGVALLALIWIATALWQVPRHRELQLGFDTRAHRALVRSNWLRTLGWSARSVLVISMLWGWSFA